MWFIYIFLSVSAAKLGKILFRSKFFGKNLTILCQKCRFFALFPKDFKDFKDFYSYF